MDNEIWFISEEWESLPTKINTEFGRVYVVAFNDSEVKIGCSYNVSSRIKKMASYQSKYGSSCIGQTVIYSQPHINYRENEKKIHSFFKKRRKPKSELFLMTTDEFLSEVHNVGLVFKDETDPDYIERDRKGKEFINSIASSIAHCPIDLFKED